MSGEDENNVEVSAEHVKEAETFKEEANKHFKGETAADRCGPCVPLFSVLF